MDLGQHVSLGWSSARDAWSWLLVLAMAAKIASTALLLTNSSGRSHWIARHEPALWWTTKLSALALCLAAAALCDLASDQVGARAFGALLLAAIVLVIARVRRRAAARRSCTP